MEKQGQKFLNFAGLSLFRQIFSKTFGRENLLKYYHNGNSEVALVTRQLGDDGIYRDVKTVDYFVKSTYSDDVLVISLCENL